jgi:catechol 2,3-dioxygenase-like lactoylglutathione lyase family enzyme
MADEPGESPEGGLAALVPELVVADLAASLRFWCDLLGFQITYQRPEDEFAYLQRGRAQVMLEVSKGNWQTGKWERPLGRGINLQILRR